VLLTESEIGVSSKLCLPPCATAWGMPAVICRLMDHDTAESQMRADPKRVIRTLSQKFGDHH